MVSSKISIPFGSVFGGWRAQFWGYGGETGTGTLRHCTGVHHSNNVSECILIEYSSYLIASCTWIGLCERVCSSIRIRYRELRFWHQSDWNAYYFTLNQFIRTWMQYDDDNNHNNQRYVLYEQLSFSLTLLIRRSVPPVVLAKSQPNWEKKTISITQPIRKCNKKIYVHSACSIVVASRLLSLSSPSFSTMAAIIGVVGDVV